MAKSTNKKRKVIVDSTGEAHINASFNNIIISITNLKGEVISWSSAGKMGFRGSKKNTPYAAQTAAEDCAKPAFDAGAKNWCCHPHLCNIVHAALSTYHFIMQRRREQFEFLD